ncbi:hypothetical protein BOTBODRAFT_529555 [Botryobasidium botryosum FD-172 SS1]|uniref:Uncharacterized protein n=1 Tax=Botryobasidium botryosum (strain FD-172 SS1) TaxID=930990 RepID=A0A067M1F4_BOTB1|nr:hypothetical protein BOTBODRAFT_529555 [Botryobasidium botryosum FD-172 SS1]
MHKYVRMAGFFGLSEPPPIPQSLRNPRGFRPFHFAPDDRIICFYLDFWHVANGDHILHPHALMFTHSSTLSNYAKYLSVVPDGQSRRIPWEAWGPSNARWMEGNFDSSYYSYVHGSRFAYKLPSSYDDTGETQIIRMFDFNPYAVRHSAKVVPAENGEEGTDADGLRAYEEDMTSGITHRDVTSPSVVSAGSFFVDDVHSSLPYREVARAVQYAEDFSILIDEANIILLTEDHTMRVHTM